MAEPSADTTASTTPPPKPAEGSLRGVRDLPPAEYEAAKRKLTGGHYRRALIGEGA